MRPMAPDPVPGSISRGQWAALFVLCLGFFMVLLGCRSCSR